MSYAIERDASVTLLAAYMVARRMQDVAGIPFVRVPVWSNTLSERDRELAGIWRDMADRAETIASTIVNQMGAAFKVLQDGRNLREEWLAWLNQHTLDLEWAADWITNLDHDEGYLGLEMFAEDLLLWRERNATDSGDAGGEL